MENKLLPGQESIPHDEHEYIQQMIDDLHIQLKELYKNEDPSRAAHRKMHGCVKAEFTILDNLDDTLKVGIFKEPKTYQAYVRFSNAEGKIKQDYDKDVRGMAIKLFGVPGHKLHNEPRDTNTQDFVLIDNEVFISKDVKEFQKILRAVAGGNLKLIGFLLNPMHFPIVLRLGSYKKRCHHVLAVPYWSATPYLFGNDRAVKYHAAPSTKDVTGGIVKTDTNFLKTNMKNTLGANDVLFDFFVQFQTDPKRMPIEDPTVKWGSPFIKVAQIKIHQQDFDTEEQNHTGQDFSFSPWHSLPEHKPLGGLNRARKAIYYTMSDFWHRKNSAYTPEA